MKLLRKSKKNIQGPGSAVLVPKLKCHLPVYFFSQESNPFSS